MFHSVVSSSHLVVSGSKSTDRRSRLSTAESEREGVGNQQIKQETYPRSLMFNQGLVKELLCE